MRITAPVDNNVHKRVNMFWERLIHELTELSVNNDMIALILCDIKQQISAKDKDCSWDHACNILVNKYMVSKYEVDASVIKQVQDVIQRIRNDGKL